MDIEKKICSKCASEKIISDFYIKDIYKGKRRFDKFCKACKSNSKSKKRMLCDSDFVSSVEKNKSSSVLKQVVKEDVALTCAELNDVLEVVLRLRIWHQAIIADFTE